MKIDLTQYVATLIDLCRLQADLIDKLFMELIEVKCTEEMDKDLPFMMEQAAEYRKPTNKKSIVN